MGDSFIHGSIKQRGTVVCAVRWGLLTSGRQTEFRVKGTFKKQTKLLIQETKIIRWFFFPVPEKRRECGRVNKSGVRRTRTLWSWCRKVRKWKIREKTFHSNSRLRKIDLPMLAQTYFISCDFVYNINCYKSSSIFCWIM